VAVSRTAPDATRRTGREEAGGGRRDFGAAGSSATRGSPRGRADKPACNKGPLQPSPTGAFLPLQPQVRTHIQSPVPDLLHTRLMPCRQTARCLGPACGGWTAPQIARSACHRRPLPKRSTEAGRCAYPRSAASDDQGSTIPNGPADLNIYARPLAPVNVRICRVSDAAPGGAGRMGLAVFVDAD